MFRMLTYEAQVSIVIVLVLITIMLSFYAGWKVGWMRAVDFMMEHVGKKMAKAIEEVSNEQSNN